MERKREYESAIEKAMRKVDQTRGERKNKTIKIKKYARRCNIVKDKYGEVRR